MKRTLCLFLALILAVGICFSAPVTITASAAETTIIEKGNCGATGSSVQWKVDNTNTLTISGTGAMADYTNFNTRPWRRYRTGITAVVIEDGVTAIGNAAFYEFSALQSVKIGNGVTEIGAKAFSSCKELVDLTIGNSVQKIGNSAFSSCTKLVEVSFPHYIIIDEITNNVDKNYSVFSGCTSLESVTFADGISAIAQEFFYNCSSLKSITGLKSVESIRNQAFYGCKSLESVTFGRSLKSIGSNIFYGCTSLKSINVSNNSRFSSVDGVLFYDKDTSRIRLIAYPAGKEGESYTIPDNVTTIGDNAFATSTNLVEVIIPDSVTTIGQYAFDDCTALKSVKIPKYVINIEYGAFDGCAALKTVEFPDYVGSINKAIFKNCTSLESVTLPEGVGTIGDEFFYNCKSLKSVTIPDDITSIGQKAFYACESLEQITIPDSVKTIGEGAFCDCTALTSVTIGKGVTTIGDYAFAGSQYVNLTVVLGSYAHQFAKTNSIPYIFNGYSKTDTEQIKKLTFTPIYKEADNENSEITGYSVTAHDKTISGALTIPSTYNDKPVTSIGIHAFSSCTSLETVTIGNSVTSIGDYAFSGCEALATVTIPDSVTTIGNYTFNACTALATVTIPDSVTTIGNYTFNACTALATVKIGNKVSTIGGSAFNGCGNMTLTVVLGSYAHQFAKTNSIPYIFNGYNKAETAQIEKLTFTLNEDGESYSVTGCDTSISGELKIPATYNGKPVTKIGNNAFWNCKSLTSVVIPDSVVSLGEKAFYVCVSLETVTLSSNITVIPKEAFAYCESLKTLPITENVASIGECAFYGSGKYSKVSLSGVTIGSEAFRFCGITELTLKNCKLNDASAFINNKIEKLAILETDIPDEMFGNSYIKTLDAENSVLGSRAFSSCSGLENVTVSEGKINNGAFADCSSLETVTIDNIVSVGEFAFNNCPNLKTVEVNATKISEYAFSMCTSLENVKLGDELKVIEKNAFEECRELTEIVIPESVTTIGEEALIGCSDLKYIFFEGTEDAQKTIGDTLVTNAKIHYGSSTHTFNENYTVDVEPTCTEKGSESQHCKYCDLTQNERPVKENGHTSVNGGTEGAHTICSVCKEPLSTTHNLTSKITTAPTCTEEGVETFTCECGYSYEEVIPCLIPGEIKAEEAESNSFSATVVDINSIVTKLQLTEEEKALIEQGADMKIVFKLSDIGATINTPEKEAIFKALTNEKIAVFLDIQLVKQIANSSVNVQKLNDLIKVTVELPAELVNKDGNIKRSYSVLRYHDGDETKVTTLNAKFDETTGTLTFDTDRFSTYAIVYSDVVVSNGEGAPGTPDSGDGEVSTPETPKDETTPGTPETPKDETTPGTPENPKDETTPGTPETPKDETTPGTPETPKDDVSSDKTDDSVTNDKNDASSETGTNDKNDTSKDDVPKAGVISTTSIWLGAMALSGFGALLVSKKKKED